MAFRPYFGWLLSLSVAGSVACNSTDSTTGKRVTLETRATTDNEIESTFTTSVGWNVTLDKAAAAIGSFSYFDGEPAFVRREVPPAGPLERFASFVLGEGVAHAHPGHYQAGNALGEMLVPGSVDLFGGDTSLGDGDGVSGTYRSARFTFAKTVAGSAADELDDHIAFAEGTATKAGDGGASPAIHFRIAADFADVAKSVTQGEVDGCEFKEAEVQDDGIVTLTFTPSIWFDLVDFSKVDPGTSDEPTTIASGDIAQIGFALGLVQLTAYHFGYSR
jgi:hypothetical protein